MVQAKWSGEIEKVNKMISNTLFLKFLFKKIENLNFVNKNFKE